MDFETVFRLIIDKFQKNNVRFAIIGGFALHMAGYTRATQDIDFLVAKEDMPKVKEIMASFGYELLHESEDVSNFHGKMTELGRVDFLHAHRKYTKKMLERAREYDILNNAYKGKFVGPEDLIGLKVQSSSNDPDRYHRDMADIEFLIRANAGQLNIDWIREYFQLFDREDELNEILIRVKNVNPQRKTRNTQRRT